MNEIKKQRKKGNEEKSKEIRLKGSKKEKIKK